MSCLLPSKECTKRYTKSKLLLPLSYAHFLLEFLTICLIRLFLLCWVKSKKLSTGQEQNLRLSLWWKVLAWGFVGFRSCWSLLSESITFTGFWASTVYCQLWCWQQQFVWKELIRMCPQLQILKELNNKVQYVESFKPKLNKNFNIAFAQFLFFSYFMCFINNFFLTKMNKNIKFNFKLYSNQTYKLYNNWQTHKTEHLSSLKYNRCN